MSANIHLPPTLEDRLVSQYGELIEIRELAALLKYPSALALKRAVAAKKMAIEFSQIGRRRVVATRDVARLLVAAGIHERPGGD